MAHFVTLDGSNVVTTVNVIADADCEDAEGNESEAVGIAFCVNLWGAGTYKQTSYNHNTRKQFGFTGCTYDATADEYVLPKPYASWTLNSDNDWIAPLSEPSVSYPVYTHWNESAYQADNTTGWETVDES